MSVRINGLASGLPPNLVDQVIEAERMPIKQMQGQKNTIEDKVKLVTDLETKINDISKNLTSIVGARGFVDRKFESSFPDIITGTLDPNVAEKGEWTLEVVQLAGKPSAVTNGFPDKDKTTLGVGYIKFQTEEGEKEVYITEGDSTLEKIAAAINRSGAGVRAMVVNDRSDKEDSFKLEISGLKTGDDNEVKFPTVYLLDGRRDLQFVATNKAQNAKYKIDGHEFEATENKITDLIPGVVLDLKKAKPNEVVNLKVTENYEVIADKLKTFVDSYNGALAFIQNQNKLTPDRDGNQRLGPLGGDSMVRMTESRLRSMIQDPQQTNSKFKRILELGVEFNRNGTLNLNQDKFNKIVSENPEDVVEFLRGDFVTNGFVTTMKNRLGSIVDAQSGPVTTRKKSMQERMSQIDRRIDAKERMLSKREEQLRRQFAKMEESMSKLQTQGASAAIGGGG
ncbi:flagellar filament capping protein FliD [Pseudobdellovibrio exovorus]|uniref:Flagellar hook-associated protein 2 n=1 Tax=Pseudobdellovibrio exovorus JSS TaxID=1184267 RepID=M4VAP1_9BACT|nr:flagellar filament capping protein FliD [Pseudobdellovibrio exovorus]AGH96298.1 flagellar hook associated protein [Pseudobdellovibrio exovorus JSS]